MGEYRFEMAATKDLPTLDSLGEALRDQVLDHPELWVKVPDFLAHRVEVISVRCSPNDSSVHYPFNRHGIRAFGRLVVEKRSDVDDSIWIRQYADGPEGMLDYVEAFNSAVGRGVVNDISLVIRGESVKLIHEAVRR